MKRLHLALLVGMGLTVLTGNSWGQAVSVDASSLISRLDAMETRLGTVESRRASASAAAGTPSIGGVASYTAADLENRMADLERDSGQMRGTSERALQAIEALAKKFDAYAKDMDMRMADMEARVDSLAEKQTAAPAAAVDNASESVEAAKPVATPTPATPAATAKPTAAIPAGMSASEHYNKAYAFLTATDYKNSQIWFEEFLKRHSTDALADNAYYWLGEVYLVQNNPSAAVGKFRDGIKAFPKGSKVTANLFKMGVALEQLKQPKLAKAAWDKLLKDYPNAPEAARAKDKLVNLKMPAA